jgi:hypothetical protein
MGNTLAGLASSSQAPDRDHISESPPPPAFGDQSGQRDCDQCGKPFMPRQHTGGSVQRFCCTTCRLDWHKERQRAQRVGLYAGQLTIPATPQARPCKTLPSKAAVGLLTEFVLALRRGETAGTRIETWPPEVRAFVEGHVSCWVEENKNTRVVRAMAIAAPKHGGVQSCVVILHHCTRE